jgi:hypothetical protein
VVQTPGRSLVAGPAAGEDALAIVRYPLADGTTEWAMLLTESGMFRWGNTTPGAPRQWHRVTGSGLTGTTRYATTAGEDWLFVAREGHAIKQWNGAVASGYQSIVDSGTFPGANPPQAKFVEYFNDRLVLGWTVEDGVSYANRLRWPMNGDHKEWSGNGSGWLDLYEGNAAPIQGMKGLGGRLAVYQPNAILDVIPTGELATVFVTETRVRGIGCRAPYTIRSAGQQHFFLGTDGLAYSWDGTNLRNIAEPIQRELRALVYPSVMGSYFGAISTSRQEYWLVLGAGDVFVYDYARDLWSRDSFPDITALGEVTDTRGTILWDAATGTWDATPLTWGDYGGASYDVLWAGRSDGATFAVDETVNYDYFAVGSIVDRYCETPDWYAPNVATNAAADPAEMATLQRLLLCYEYTTATPFEVGISIDRGQTWQSQQVTPVAAGFSWVSCNVTGNTFRFRFRETDPNASFRWRSYQYELVPGGQYLG